MRSWSLHWKRLALALTLLVSRAAAAEGGTRIVLVADSRRFTGWEAWWANIYNESRLYFTLLTIVIIPLLGLIMGKATGLLLARLGIDLKSRALKEH